LLAIFAGCMSFNLSAQSPETIIITGTLADINEDRIAGEQCDVKLTMISQNDTVAAFNTEVSTDENGRFTYYVSDLPELFGEAGRSDSVRIVLTIIPSTENDWMEETAYPVSYTLLKKGPHQFVMKRFEGQVLEHAYSEPVGTFSDSYPFGYLATSFIISFSTDMKDPEVIIEAARQMMPEEMEEAAPPPSDKRGIKGGYAVGGYHKK